MKLKLDILQPPAWHATLTSYSTPLTPTLIIQQFNLARYLSIAVTITIRASQHPSHALLHPQQSPKTYPITHSCSSILSTHKLEVNLYIKFN